MTNCNEAVCVYDIVLNGEVVYVGMTKHPKVRKWQHTATGVCPKNSDLVVHKWYENRKDAAFAEKQRQQELMPAFCKDLVIYPKVVDDRPAFDWVAYRKKMEDLKAALTEEDIAYYENLYNERFKPTKEPK